MQWPAKLGVDHEFMVNLYNKFNGRLSGINITEDVAIRTLNNRKV
jgi:hypothetical protein